MLLVLGTFLEDEGLVVNLLSTLKNWENGGTTTLDAEVIQVVYFVGERMPGGEHSPVVV